MQHWDACLMRTETIHVRDVPAADVQILRERAVAREMPLSGYLRELIHDEASRPTIDESPTSS